MAEPWGALASLQVCQSAVRPMVIVWAGLGEGLVAAR